VLAELLTNCFDLLLKALERVVSDSAMPKDTLISIVDDDNALRISLEDLIQAVGYRVQGFSSAAAFCFLASSTANHRVKFSTAAFASV
jgi:hypothetical protein